MNRETKLVKNTAILSIGTFLPKFATFITLPVLTAFLSKEQYGTYDLVTILVMLILPITTLQIHTAAFRFLIEHKGDRNIAKVYLSNILAFVVPVASISLCLLFFLVPILDIETRIWICVYLFFDTLVEEARQITRGLSQNLDYSISAIINAVMKMILTLILVQLIKMELKGAIIALALSPILSLIYLVVKVRLYELIDFRLVSKRVLKEMLLYSWPMVPNNMSGWIMRVSDRFVVTAYLGLSANAIYAVANKIPSMLTLAQSTFNMAWQENASMASSDRDAEAYYSKMFSVMLNFYAGCLGLIIACTPVLFKLLFKGDYSESIFQMPILFLATFFSCMASFLGGIYIAYKETKSVGITTLMAAICNLVINLALIKFIGLYAASISTLISFIFLFVYRMIKIRKFIKIKYSVCQISIPLIVIVIESAMFYVGSPIVNFINAVFGVITCILLNKDILEKILLKVKKFQK